MTDDAATYDEFNQADELRQDRRRLGGTGNQEAAPMAVGGGLNQAALSGAEYASKGVEATGRGARKLGTRGVKRGIQLSAAGGGALGIPLAIGGAALAGGGAIAEGAGKIGKTASRAGKNMGDGRVKTKDEELDRASQLGQKKHLNAALDKAMNLAMPAPLKIANFVGKKFGVDINKLFKRIAIINVSISLFLIITVTLMLAYGVTHKWEMFKLWLFS